MELTLFVLIILVGIIIYLGFQLRFKKTKGKTLRNELSDLTGFIKEKDEVFTTLSSELVVKNKELKHLIELEDNEHKLINSVKDSNIRLEIIQAEFDRLEDENSELSDHISSIKKDISIYQPVADFLSVGFVEEPTYLFETSERFKEEIKFVREQQKDYIRHKEAIVIPDSIALTSNKTYINKILGGQSKLMLKAFNVECDNLMLMVKPSNYVKILERIDKLATELEKTSLSLKCGFEKDYVELKFKECELQYQYKLKEEREKEEQAAIKEQMREEQQAIREFEKALAKAQKEEKMYKDALELAKKELATSGTDDKDKLLSKIALLEKQLQDAMDNEKRAMSMAEQTRRGHVYVISNIGSFGENVYKIGLTRRLEPLDRVKELGDASVPFKFDVHAMIFSEDAPALETRLHREFTQYRVNQVNHRKEFFKVDLLDIKKKTNEIVGNDIDFKLAAIAEDYYETLKMHQELELV
jgi:hypothetical protein